MRMIIDICVSTDLVN